MARSCLTAAVLAAATKALGHVTLNPREVAAGGFAKFEIRVPNERPDASTTSIELILPEDPPLLYVSVKPHPRWTPRIERRVLARPVESHGERISEVVSKITWEGGPIRPGEFDEVEISVGPLPREAGSLTFGAIQTYDSGEVVAWTDAPPESEGHADHPAPAVTVRPAPASATAQDGVARVRANVAIGLGVGGLILGAIGAVAALRASRVPA